MWVYGALIGLLTVVIRYYSGLPEGVMYAILIGNAATPLIERITQPTPFGKSGLLRPRTRRLLSAASRATSRAKKPGAVTPKKRLLKNKPQVDERRRQHRPCRRRPRDTHRGDDPHAGPGVGASAA